MMFTAINVERESMKVNSAQVFSVEHIDEGVAVLREPPHGINLIHVLVHDVVDILTIEAVNFGHAKSYSLYHFIIEVPPQEVPVEVADVFKALGLGDLPVFKQTGKVEDKYPMRMYWAIDTIKN